MFLPSGHNVVVVDDFNERLDARSLSNAFLTHRLCNLQRILFDTSDNGVGVFALFSTIIKVLDDDGFLTGVSAVQNDNNFTSYDVCQILKTRKRENPMISFRLIATIMSQIG
jgi:hypothetical protein